MLGETHCCSECQEPHFRASCSTPPAAGPSASIPAKSRSNSAPIDGLDKKGLTSIPKLNPLLSACATHLSYPTEGQINWSTVLSATAGVAPRFAHPTLSQHWGCRPNEVANLPLQIAAEKVLSISQSSENAEVCSAQFHLLPPQN